MIVRCVLRALVIIATEMLIVLAKDMKRAGHAEMHEKNIAGGQIGEQIFGPPADATDGLALEALRKILRQRPAQVAAATVHLDEARAFHRRCEAAAHRLDFGQFGHGLGYAAERSLVVRSLMAT